MTREAHQTENSIGPAGAVRSASAITIAKLSEIADEIRLRWPTTGRIALLHRVGQLEHLRGVAGINGEAWSPDGAQIAFLMTDGENFPEDRVNPTGTINGVVYNFKTGISPMYQSVLDNNWSIFHASKVVNTNAATIMIAEKAADLILGRALAPEAA